MRSAAIVTFLLLAPLGASATHVDDGLAWACGFGGSGRDGHPDACGIDPIGGNGVGSVDTPEWGNAWIDEDEEVLGVVINGDARAVPVEMLDRHEILNDDIGGVPVAVTYCPLCGSGITFDRRVDDQTLTFAPSGFLYKHDLVMWDAETGTLWTQILGEPIATLHDRHADEAHMDATLSTYPTLLVTWVDWQAAHPDARMLQAVPGIRYGGAYGGYGDSCSIGISGESTCDIDGLHPKEQVLGIESPRGTIAFPYFAVVGTGGIAVDEATGTMVSIDGAHIQAFDVGRHHFNQSGGWFDETGRQWDLANGTLLAGGESLAPLESTTMYWFAWQTHHPSTALWLPPQGEVPPGAKTLEDNGKLPGFTIGIVAVLLVGAAWALRRR